MLDLAGGEGGLGQHAVAPPGVALAGQQPLADQAAQPPRQFVLPVEFVVAAQHALDVVGVAEQVERSRVVIQQVLDVLVHLQRLARNGANVVADKFDQRKQIEQIEEIYLRMISDSGKENR